MATDYEKIYLDERHALGTPTKEFVDFFAGYEKKHVSVLDIGCGQGRDALFIARLGHRVTGIDLSPAGIRDLLQDASNEGLKVDAEVADIRHYRPRACYDVVVIDRTLHMLEAIERLSVLRTLLGCLSTGGALLIADERSNLPAFEMLLDESEWAWKPILKRGGYLFVQRD